MEKKGNILAIIVTHNRLHDLKRCLESLYHQSVNDFDILVVNNASTDGTAKYLLLQPNIMHINQANLGGAGGFHTGMKYMYDHDYKWLWMMDDDGEADKEELQNLLQYGHLGNKVLNALVVDKDNHELLSFKNVYAHEVAEARKKEVIDQFVHPFNGTLIHRDIIEQIGLVKKEMFIWGDEGEYMARIKKRCGITPLTITSAIHYHPKEKGDYIYLLPFTKKFLDINKPQTLSHHYYRNKGYIMKNYGSNWKGIGSYILLRTCYFLRTWNLKELLKFYKYFFMGLKNDYQ
jgi:rhamnopyranosyl-N-acetylglucosaminyl-diphospho-decaprenol beta-1,3/1,4-galactofuranosyltransferase